ncbi:hypothetical protein C2G38_2160889 [Gigaspora rosea]|uniref:Uncharacterized protein n=1 Tax=Gigaspora rosea TaxID=44941 RepID=A0A397VXQ2_9GLOM|nr:hypothetical protein C2G38_2160889 [Gigaspora rosea]
MEEGYGIKDLKTNNQVEEFTKDFSKLDNLIEFKQLVEDFEIKLTEDILINALESLSDASSFKCQSESTMVRLEVHLRTWMATLERVYYSPCVLRYEVREQLYRRLRDFDVIHHGMTNAFKQGVGNSFKSKGKSMEISNNNNIYMNFPNCDIKFLLVHLRDTLHNMRDDETRIDEGLRRMNDILLTFINIAPKAAGASLGNISEAFGIAEILPNLSKVFSFKYPINYWYPTWRLILLTHYFLENLTKDEKYELITPPNSLWFGILDLAQHLSQKTTQIISLALCYYLGLESLRNSKCTYICFKSLELLLSLSNQKPELFKEIVKEDIENYKESLSTTSQQILEKISHDITQKIQIKIKYESVAIINEKLETKNKRRLIST